MRLGQRRRTPVAARRTGFDLDQTAGKSGETLLVHGKNR
jgi:hypothetical protein